MTASQTSDRKTRGLTFVLLGGVAVAALMTAPALAQTTTAAAASAAPAADPTGVDVEVEEVVVNGVRRDRGAVAGDIAPELQMTPRDIRAYGAATLSDLIDALAPQTQTAQGNGGRPVILINGARVSGFAEIRDLPTEAIARVDILPEEVSLKYGYPAEQKVVNIVLRQRFRAFTAEAGYTAPTQKGGADTYTAQGNLLHILRERRLQLGIKATADTELLESERDLVARPDAAFRTLKPEARDVAVNGVVTRPLGNGVSGTLNGSFESSDSDAKLGLSPFTPDALKRHSETTDGRIATVVNGAYAGWQWSYTGALEEIDDRSTTQRALAGVGFTDRSKSVTRSADSDIVLNKSLFHLPAGSTSVTLTGKVSALDFESESSRNGLSRSADLSRNSGLLQTSIDVPITKRGQNASAGVGNISGNLNLSVETLSDFGDLTNWGYGVHWNPIKPVRVIASFNRSEAAPTVNQLGDPIVATPGVRVFDLKLGQTAEITRINGGSPTLDGSQRDVAKLGLTFKPYDKLNLTFSATYTSSSTRDAIAAFPSSNTQVEDAFPDRFIRDASGQLVQIDARPVNFAEQDRDELRWGFTFSKPLPSNRPPGGFTPGQGQRQGQGERQDGRRAPERAAAGGQGGAAVPAAPGQDAAPAEGARPPGMEALARGGPGEGAPGGGFAGAGPGGGSGGPGGRGGFGGGGFGGPRGGFGGGVFQVGLYHTVAFRDEILIRPGVPKLDLLDGAAIGSGGGSPRHQVDLQANLTRNGLGAAMNAKWQSGTIVRGAGGATGGDLNFSDLTTVNLRLFADLGARPIARDHRWLRGARVSLAVNNLFDEHQEVRTAAGVTPVSYQEDYLDPVGRSIRLSLRKLFF